MCQQFSARPILSLVSMGGWGVAGRINKAQFQLQLPTGTELGKKECVKNGQLRLRTTPRVAYPSRLDQKSIYYKWLATPTHVEHASRLDQSNIRGVVILKNENLAWQ